MLSLLAEKFIKDDERLSKIKEMINMGAIAEMIREDNTIEIAKNFLKAGVAVEVVKASTGLDEATIERLQAELENE